MPATGWYEWQKIDAKTKQPFHFQPAAKPFALAGIYDTWKGRDGLPDVTSYSVVTTSPAPSKAAYHGRRIQSSNWPSSSTKGIRSPETAAAMMKPHAGAIDVWPVSKDVDNVRNNRPELMERTASARGPHS